MSPVYRSLPQICFLDPWILFQKRSLALHYNLAGLQNIGSMGQPECGLCVLLHQKNSRALLIDLLNNPKYSGYNDWCKTERRFIKEQQFWLGHERPADCKHLLLPTRERPTKLPAPLGKRGEQYVHMLDYFGKILTISRKRSYLRFSLTVMRGKIRRPSGTCETPMVTISCTGLPDI